MLGMLDVRSIKSIITCTFIPFCIFPGWSPFCITEESLRRYWQRNVGTCIWGVGIQYCSKVSYHRLARQVSFLLRCERNEMHLTRNKTRGGNLLLSGFVCGLQFKFQFLFGNFINWFDFDFEFSFCLQIQHLYICIWPDRLRKVLHDDGQTGGWPERNYTTGERLLQLLSVVACEEAHVWGSCISGKSCKNHGRTGKKACDSHGFCHSCKRELVIHVQHVAIRIRLSTQASSAWNR